MLSGLTSRVERWFGLEESWERPRPGSADLRRDLAWAVVAFLVGALGQEMIRSVGALEEERFGPVGQYAVIGSLIVFVALRRRFPVTVMVVAGVHIVVAAYLAPGSMSQLIMQLTYFMLIYSGVAWARNRRAMLGGAVFVVLMLLVWFAWNFAVSSGVETIMTSLGEDADERFGLVSPFTGVVVYTLMSNAIFYAFAIGLGAISWHGARRRAQVAEQAQTLRAQAARLRDQAVVAERLRIARELHDVVAHHVSVMGVQASAARRVMDRDPESARQALGAVETSSRNAVGQMRDLLGTLRSEELESGARADTGDGRSPQPTLADLPALAEEASTPVCRATVTVVESSPGAAGRVPAPVQLSAYRVVQEALANVRRHSSAHTAQAVVRVDEDADRLEVEVVDDGSPRPGTSGTGLGLRGMRERAQHLGGGVEAGPRTGTSGWRVRVWFRLGGAPAAEKLAGERITA